MQLNKNAFTFTNSEIAPWTVPTIQFDSPTDTPLRLSVIGTIINSITDGPVGKEKQQSWKVQVASAVKAKRGERPWSPSASYAISLALCFCPENHGHRSRGLDVENFIKPILDAIAAGLLYDEETDLSTVKKWNYNDSNFNTLLIHRLADATKRQDEGIAISVSSSASHPFTGSG